MSLGNDDSRCTAWPADRATVRPCENCQECKRWRELFHGGEQTPQFTTPPAMWDYKRGEFFCAYFIQA